MKYDSQKHHRKSHRLRGHDYAAAGVYFVTIVTKDRTNIFGQIDAGDMVSNSLGHIADECFLAIPAHFANVEIDVYQIMPNHLHGIIVIHGGHHHATARGPSPVGATHWVAPDPGYRATHCVAPTPVNHTGPRGPKRGSIGAIVGAYKMAVTRRAMRELGLAHIWQRNYHDRIIRNPHELAAIRKYIRLNPAKWTDTAENP